MLKCKNASKYKGLRKPKCGGGRGCDACQGKYYETQWRLSNEQNAAKASISFMNKELVAPPEDFESVLANAAYCLKEKIKHTEHQITMFEMRQQLLLLTGEQGKELERCRKTLVHYKRWHKLALAMADVVE